MSIVAQFDLGNTVSLYCSPTSIGIIPSNVQADVNISLFTIVIYVCLSGPPLVIIYRVCKSSRCNVHLTPSRSHSSSHCMQLILKNKRHKHKLLHGYWPTHILALLGYGAWHVPCIILHGVQNRIVVFWRKTTKMLSQWGLFIEDKNKGN